MKINPKYKEIATKCLYEDSAISREDIQSLGLFHNKHIERMLEMDEFELKSKLIDIITRQSVVVIK